MAPKTRRKSRKPGSDIHRLSLGVAPIHDESLTGYLTRLIQFSRVRIIGRFDKNFGVSGFPGDSRITYPETLKLVADLTDDQIVALDRGESSAHCLYQGIPLPVRSYKIPTKSRRVCPYCIEESPYHRSVWDLLYIRVCPIHRCELGHNCADCGQELHWTTTADPARCQCGESLASVRSKAVSEKQARGTAAVYGLLGDLRFADDANVVRALPHFQDMPDGSIISFLIQFGAQLWCQEDNEFGKSVLLMERSSVMAKKAPDILSAGLHLAKNWPTTLEFMLDGMSVSETSPPQLEIDELARAVGRVRQWYNYLPSGSGKAIAATIQNYCRSVQSDSRYFGQWSNKKLDKTVCTLTRKAGVETLSDNKIAE